jgi:hypothetical protein
MRVIHLFVICALIFAASYVYRIKMESAVRTERVLKLRADIREQRNIIASLKAEWAKLETPGRLQDMSARHLSLRPIDATQYDTLKNLPPRPPSFVKPGDPDPIGTIIESVDQEALAAGPQDQNPVTGSVPSPEGAR